MAEGSYRYEPLSRTRVLINLEVANTVTHTPAAPETASAPRILVPELGTVDAVNRYKQEFVKTISSVAKLNKVINLLHITISSYFQQD